MNPIIPAPAALLLDFISKPESGGGYDVIFGNHQNLIPQKITTLSLSALRQEQATWSHNWGSNAAGRYQIMSYTLEGLMHDLALTGTEVFTPNLQDMLAYHLLIRRGYAMFMAGHLTVVAFAKSLAEEWASLPVLEATLGAHRTLTRGQSYYAGDGLNHAEVTPTSVEMVLNNMLKMAGTVVAPAAITTPTKVVQPPPSFGSTPIVITKAPAKKQSLWARFLALVHL